MLRSQRGCGEQSLFLSAQVARWWLVTACRASLVSHGSLKIRNAGKKYLRATAEASERQGNVLRDGKHGARSCKDSLPA